MSDLRINRLYFNDGDLTDQPVGPLAWTDYICGDHIERRAMISFSVDSSEAIEIILMGHHVDDRPIEEHLANMETAIANMRALLNDERVIAARAAWEAQQHQAPTADPAPAAGDTHPIPDAHDLVRRLNDALDRAPAGEQDRILAELTAICNGAGDR